MDTHGLLSYLENVHRPAKALIKLVPPDKLDWKPAKGNFFTIGQLMYHLADGAGDALNACVTGEWGFPPEDNEKPDTALPPAEDFPSCSVEEALQRLDASLETARKVLSEISEDDFQSKQVCPPWDQPAPMWRHMLVMVEHMVNHKCQLFMYLKLLGVPVHTGTLYYGE